MKKSIYILLFIFHVFISPARINAQYDFRNLEDITDKWEIGFTGGATAFLGDLGGNKGAGKPFIKDFNKQTSRLLAGAHLDYFVSNWLSAKLSINFTNVDGADSLVKNEGNLEKWRSYRNLSFRSRILEANVSAEVFPLMLLAGYDDIHRINPYVGMGIGLFHFNPQANYDGEWINLQPLRLEGQGFAEEPGRKKYKLVQLYIPVTLGLKVYVNNSVALGMGVIFRHTFTDYIDDIHTSYIDPSLFDKYTIGTGHQGLLSTEQAAMAKQLYSRSITPWKVRPGVLKANPNNNDSYTSMFLSLSIRFYKSPKFYVGG